MRKNPRIRIICDASNAYFRDVIIGARHSAFVHGCSVLNEHWILPGRESLESIMAHSAADGLIVQVQNRAMENKLIKLNLPTVVISDSLPDSRLPSMSPDFHEVGRVGADHLASRLCSSYACWGQTAARYSARQVSGFRTRLRELGRTCRVREGPSILEQSAYEIMREMRTWLRSLSLPVGILAVNDVYGSMLLQVARQLKWRIPEDIAILSVGNDEFWVNFEETPLSSIKLPSQRLGYEAVRLLTELMNGRAAAPLSRTPDDIAYEVATRASTDILFIPDPAVAQAASFIRENADREISAADVVQASGISRVALQQRFKNATGRSILAEIHRIRIERAKDCLRTTDHKLDLIAERCCFGNAQRFCAVFRKYTGQSPGHYRKISRKMGSH